MAYAHPDTFELSFDDLMSRMSREEVEPSEIMKAGTALHKFLEHAKAGDEIDEGTGTIVDGVRLRFGADLELPLPAIREPAVVGHTFDTVSGPVLLRGRIDARDADSWGTVTDYKLTQRFSAERYALSPQWKAYALMVGAKRFRYLIFQSKQEAVTGDPDCWWDAWVTDVHELVFWPYPEMEAEITEIVSELAEFVKKYVPGLVGENKS